MKFVRVRARGLIDAIQKFKARLGTPTEVLYASKRYNMRGRYYFNFYFTDEDGRYEHTVYIKILYKSPRGKSHNFFLETIATWVTESKTVITKDIVDWALDQLSKGNYTTVGRGRVFNEIGESLIDFFNDYVVGTTEVTVTKNELKKELEVYEYGYRI